MPCLMGLVPASMLTFSSLLQLWACCQEHKLACLSSVLKDMPYLGKTDLVH